MTEPLMKTNELLPKIVFWDRKLTVGENNDFQLHSSISEGRFYTPTPEQDQRSSDTTRVY